MPRRMTMSHIKVPRMLVLRFLPHPEEYGEALVLLANGMATDVYTTESGDLVTITNDKKLIKYLKQRIEDEQSLIIDCGHLQLKSLSFMDIDALLKIKLVSIPHHCSVLNLDNNQLQLFISHSNTYNSHVLAVRRDNILQGIIGYDIVDQTAVISYELFETHLLTNEQTVECLTTLIEFVQNKYHPTQFVTSLIRSDFMMQKIFTSSGFLIHENVDGKEMDDRITFQLTTVSK